MYFERIGIRMPVASICFSFIAAEVLAERGV
jgi:hypothetical protein